MVPASAPLLQGSWVSWQRRPVTQARGPEAAVGCVCVRARASHCCLCGTAGFCKPRNVAVHVLASKRHSQRRGGNCTLPRLQYMVGPQAEQCREIRYLSPRPSRLLKMRRLGACRSTSFSCTSMDLAVGPCPELRGCAKTDGTHQLGLAAQRRGTQRRSCTSLFGRRGPSIGPSIATGQA